MEAPRHDPARSGEPGAHGCCACGRRGPCRGARRRVVPGWATFADALRRTRDSLAAHPEGARWGTRLFVTDHPPSWWAGASSRTPRKTASWSWGTIAHARQGRGLATAATGAMIAEAFASRTSPSLPTRCPSGTPRTGVLEKVGFHFEGEAENRGETAWRFALTRRRRRRSALELTAAGQAAAGGSRRQPAPRGKSDTAGRGGRGTDPAKAAGKCHRNKPPMARPQLSRAQARVKRCGKSAPASR